VKLLHLLGGCFSGLFRFLVYFSQEGVSKYRRLGHLIMDARSLICFIDSTGIRSAPQLQ
jgi:hypothetical protein